jgi:hypothetical protein
MGIKLEDKSFAFARHNPAGGSLALLRLDSNTRRSLRRGHGTRRRVRDRDLLVSKVPLRTKTSR